MYFCNGLVVFFSYYGQFISENPLGRAARAETKSFSFTV